MPDERPYSRSAFEKAGDTAEAWRQQQLAQLTEEQKLQYDKYKRGSEEKLKAEKQRIALQKQDWIEQEKRKRRVEHQRRVLQMLPTKRPKEERIVKEAMAAADEREAIAVAHCELAKQKAQDGMLEDFARQRDEEQRRQNARDITQRSPRSDFSRAANEDSSSALARAFERATERKQRSREATQTKEQRGNRERGRE